MARFAERGYVYHNHYAAGNFTSPGTVSLLTGVYPWRHRASNLNGIVPKEYANQNLFSLADAIFHTTAYTHNPLAAIFLSQYAAHTNQYHPMRELSLAGEVYSDRVSPGQFPTAFWTETMLRGTDHFLPGSLLVSTLEEGNRNFQARSIEAGMRDPIRTCTIAMVKGRYILIHYQVQGRTGC